MSAYEVVQMAITGELCNPGFRLLHTMVYYISVHTLECLINMPTQISMSGGKKSKKLIRVLVPNKHVWWKNSKFTGMNLALTRLLIFKTFLPLLYMKRRN